MELTPACYAHLVHMLQAVCARVCAVLEGGYCLQALAEGAALTLRTLLGHAPPQLQNVSEPSDSSVTYAFLFIVFYHNNLKFDKFLKVEMYVSQRVYTYMMRYSHTHAYIHMYACVWEYSYVVCKE